jgi:hypothetical protein
MDSVEGFAWGSKLGVSVVCFLLYGAVHLLLWVLVLVSSFVSDDDRFLYMSDKADVVRYGEAPSELMARDPVLRQHRDTMFLAIGALMGSVGVTFLAIAWFGLRRGETWALLALVAAGLIVLPVYAVLLIPYVRVGAPILMSMPPYWTVPAALLVPGAVLGWLGLK